MSRLLADQGLYGAEREQYRGSRSGRIAGGVDNRWCALFRPARREHQPVASEDLRSLREGARWITRATDQRCGIGRAGPRPTLPDVIAFQVSTESAVSLTLPIEPNAGKTQGSVALRSFDSGTQNGRNSLDDSGRFLAYPKIRSNESEIWVKDLTTGQERHLVTTPLSQLNPVISHDGTKVAYGVPEGGSVAGYVIPVSGGSAVKVCDACNLQGWFADSRRILSLTPNAGRPPGRVRSIDVVDKTAHDLLVAQTSSIGRGTYRRTAAGWRSAEASGTCGSRRCVLGCSPTSASGYRW